MSNVKDAQERAVRIATKEDRARDAARAIQEKDAERAAALAKTAKLRALRLANAEAEAAAAPPAKRRSK
jgi:hypothetical protein